MEILVRQKLTDRWGQSLSYGFGLRTGRNVAGAQHFMSLLKCSSEVKSFIPDWDLCQISSGTTLHWLKNHHNEPVRIQSLIKTIEEFSFPPITNKLKKSKLSLSKRCELFEQKCLFNLMTSSERLHYTSINGSITSLEECLLPLTYHNFEVEPSEWLVSARRRLFFD